MSARAPLDGPVTTPSPTRQLSARKPTAVNRRERAGRHHRRTLADAAFVETTTGRVFVRDGAVSWDRDAGDKPKAVLDARRQDL